MPEHFPLMVPGARANGRHAEVVAPFDGSLIATVEQVGRDGVEQALRTAHSLFCDRDAWPRPAQRIEILQRTAAIMQERKEELSKDTEEKLGIRKLIG